MTLPVLLDFERQLTPEVLPEATASLLPPFADLTKTFDLGVLEVPTIFDGALPRNELSLIASEPGAGKTTFTIGLALSLVFNKTFIAGFRPKKRGRVCVMLAEDGDIPCSNRIMAWCAAFGISREEYDQAVEDGWIYARFGESAQLLDFSGGVLLTTAAYSELLAEVAEKKYDMLVVDSLIEWAGVPDENSNGMMQTAARALIRLAKASEGSVVALHHTNKVSDRSGDAGLHSIRGGGALAGKIRWGAVLTGLSTAELKRYGIDQADQFKFLRLHKVKDQYAARDGRPVYLERVRGILEVCQLVPTPEDTIARLARALADKIGMNEDNLPKWAILQGNPGAEFRRELKAEHREATKINLVNAYNLALDRRWINEYPAPEGAGDNAKIPRVSQNEVAE